MFELLMYDEVGMYFTSSDWYASVLMSEVVGVDDV